MMQKNMHKKSAKNASAGVFGRFGGGGSTRGRERAVRGPWLRTSVRGPKYNFTNIKTHTTTTTTKDERRKMKNSHSRRRAERGGGYQ